MCGEWGSQEVSVVGMDMCECLVISGGMECGGVGCRYCEGVMVCGVEFWGYGNMGY